MLGDRSAAAQEPRETAAGGRLCLLAFFRNEREALIANVQEEHVMQELGSRVERNAPRARA